MQSDILQKLNLDVKRLEKLINLYGEYFTDETIVKLESKVLKMINYVDNKYDTHYPENKIKQYVKLNSTHPELKLHFLIQDNKEIMEISFIKGGGHYYLEYLVNKVNTSTSFTKFREKFIQENSKPQVIYYNITLQLDELVQDLNEY